MWIQFGILQILTEMNKSTKKKTQAIQCNKTENDFQLSNCLHTARCNVLFMTARVFFLFCCTPIFVVAALGFAKQHVC